MGAVYSKNGGFTTTRLEFESIMTPTELLNLKIANEESPVKEDSRPCIADPVERPSHYNMGSIEVIDFIEDQKMDFRAASALKYLCRYRFKGKPLEDLKKSVWYINRIIQELERNSGS